MAYIKAILNNWVSLGIKNVNEIPKKPIKKTKTQQQDFNKVPVGLDSLFENQKGEYMYYINIEGFDDEKFETIGEARRMVDRPYI